MWSRYPEHPTRSPFSECANLTTFAPPGLVSSRRLDDSTYEVAAGLGGTALRLAHDELYGTTRIITQETRP